MSIAAALILAAVTPSAAFDAHLRSSSAGARVRVTASATILSSASVRLSEEISAPGAQGEKAQIHRQRSDDGRRILIEFH